MNRSVDYDRVVQIIENKSRVVRGRDAETGATRWLVIVVYDDAEMIVDDCDTEQEAIRSAREKV